MSNPACDLVAFHCSRREFLALMGLGSAGIALAGLTGCNGQPEDEPLTIWLIWPQDPGMPITSLLQRLAEFHPKLRAEAGTVASNNLREKLIKAARQHTLPDLFLINSAWMQDLGGEDNLLDLAPLAAADGLDPANLLVPHDFARCHRHGRLLCLPAVSARGTSMLFVNRVLLDRIGLTETPRFANWAEFTDASRRWVAQANGSDNLEYIALDPFMGPGMVIHTSLALGINAPIITEDGRRSLLDSPGSLRAAHALDHYVRDVYGAFGGYRALLQFRFRFAGQHRQPSFYALPFTRSFANISAAGSIVAFQQLGVPASRLAVQPVPGLDRLHGGILSHSLAYALNRHSPRRAAAWQTLRFLTLDPEGGGRFCLDYRRPAHLRAINDGQYRQLIGEAWDGVKQAMELDIPYQASTDDEFLRYHIFTIPMRRLQGESIETIFRDLCLKHQARLDVPADPT
ncbi:MAG: ABC transporter substrate-binding protein [Gemmatimonadota bacterium]|nr:ABC transporter substrate-binding protein [Gemmatimonadota bacterium]